MHHCDTLFVHCDSSITQKSCVRRAKGEVCSASCFLFSQKNMTQLLSTARPLPSFRGRKNPTPTSKDMIMKIQIIHESSVVNPMQIANIMCGMLDGKS